MPRPYPPSPMVPPVVRPFSLTDAQKRDIARVLGLVSLPQQITDMICEATAAHKATEVGSPDTTIGSALAELHELTKTGRPYDQAVARLSDDRSGVDYTTHGVLQPLAKAVQSGEPSAREALAAAASARAAELHAHKRVLPPTESLRFFCGVLREIFKHAAAPTLASSIDEAWHHCRQFALEVFTAAAIDHADFDAHPERLTEYLGTDITIG
jgi:hypothetical protein